MFLVYGVKGYPEILRRQAVTTLIRNFIKRHLTRAMVQPVDVTTQKLGQEQLRILNQDLESRVAERTSELRRAVDRLEAEIAERHRLEREVLEITSQLAGSNVVSKHVGYGEEEAFETEIKPLI